jgi:hypothetical protein
MMQMVLFIFKWVNVNQSISIYPPTGQIIKDDIDNDTQKYLWYFWFYAYIQPMAQMLLSTKEYFM